MAFLEYEVYRLLALVEELQATVSQLSSSGSGGGSGSVAYGNVNVSQNTITTDGTNYEYTISSVLSGAVNVVDLSSYDIVYTNSTFTGSNLVVNFSYPPTSGSLYRVTTAKYDAATPNGNITSVFITGDGSKTSFAIPGITPTSFVSVLDIDTYETILTNISYNTGDMYINFEEAPINGKIYKIVILKQGAAGAVFKEETITGNNSTTEFTISDVSSTSIITVIDNDTSDIVLTQNKYSGTSALINFDTAPTSGKQYKVLIIQ
jgi:hypothetical protein